jgi:hypothetical protein
MMGDWADVSEGDLIIGKDGFTWAVTSRIGNQVTIEREGREPFTGAPTGPVEFIDSSKAEMERAIAVSQVILGGEVVARHGTGTAGDPWLTPVTFPDAATMLSHIYLLHGTVGDGEATLSALRKQHDELHRDKGVGYQPHHHDPDFYKAAVE